ncbi:hypothetical protein DFH09DRAFT_1361050 [Mycena vulgaris]|nr:hypothetical protein DFH09DRAFT_1361050 [Mycena vulgaris]
MLIFVAACRRLQENEILQGDISLGNLSPAPIQRRGTQPYMAIDLLGPDPPPHLYRHDLESLFYVILWVVTSYHDGKRVKCAAPGVAIFGDRGSAGQEICFPHKPLPKPTANFMPLGTARTRPMTAMFSRGISARNLHNLFAPLKPSDPAFHHKTLGGFVTFAKLRTESLESLNLSPLIYPMRLQSDVNAVPPSDKPLQLGQGGSGTLPQTPQLGGRPPT